MQKRTSTVLAAVLFGSISIFSLSSCGSQADWSNVTIIAHACGGIDSNSYTNSAEALDNCISSGCEAVEIDFRFTSDSVLVCAHDWKNHHFDAPPTLNDFKKRKIKGKYTPMTAKEALAKLASTPIYLVIDTKENDVTSVYKEIEQIVSSLDSATGYKKMLVPQVYSKENFTAIQKISEYQNWIFTVYKLHPRTDGEFEDIANFCKKNGIGTVTMPKTKVNEKRIRMFDDKGIRVATHTVNGEWHMEILKQMGVGVFYTDFLRK